MAREVSAAKRGQQDLVSGPIGRTLLLFALPTLGSNVLQSLNGSVNAVWVGQFLGPRGLAATSNANLVMFLMFTTVFGFGMAATIIAGQAMGRRDVDAMRRTLGTAVGLFIILGVLTVVVGWLAAPALLRMLATPAEVYPLALAYLRVVFLAIPPSMVVVLITMALRSTGDSLTPMWFMVLSTVIDCGLNPFLIAGIGPFPRMGIAGAGMAMLTANYVGLVALIAYIYARDSVLRLRGPELRYLIPDPVLLRTILAKGFPMGLQMLVMSGASLAMIGLVNRFGTETVAAYGAINQLWSYILMPAMAVAAAVSAMAAQNIGAGRWDRIPQIARAGFSTNLALTSGLIVALLLLDRHALALFLGDHQATIDAARHINLVTSWSFVLFGIGQVYSAVMRANGVAVVPLVILFVAMFPVRLGLSLLLLPHLGENALWVSFSAGTAASLLLTALYYHYGDWRSAHAMVPGTIEAEERVLADTEPTGHMKPLS
ncbi:MATE family efflux transporter [Sphingomonas solaris]|uniref:MATE family efflux transporter n=1 Tax=Alterirhizorhabdus solaris TaxID=2529389 RepID=A0A558QY57_9SPHN|nr:MATE family efflux transporter [Sphingomonas solaris]TVV72012.1 MATE family efflux transporter [Sphingomonas solaris]